MDKEKRIAILKEAKYKILSQLVDINIELNKLQNELGSPQALDRLISDLDIVRISDFDNDFMKKNGITL